MRCWAGRSYEAPIYELLRRKLLRETLGPVIPGCEQQDARLQALMRECAFEALYYEARGHEQPCA